MFRRSAEGEADRAATKEAKEAKRTEKRAALQATLDAHQANKQEAKEAKETERAAKRAALQATHEEDQTKKQEAKEAQAAARAETLVGSRFASTPCYDSLWTYAVVFPDRVEERKKDDSIVKVRFLRDVTGVEATMATAVDLRGAGWSDTFYCKGQAEAQRMMTVVTSLLSGSGSPIRDDD